MGVSQDEFGLWEKAAWEATVPIAVAGSSKASFVRVTITKVVDTSSNRRVLGSAETTAHGLGVLAAAVRIDFTLSFTEELFNAPAGTTFNTLRSNFESTVANTQFASTFTTQLRNLGVSESFISRVKPSTVVQATTYSSSRTGFNPSFQPTRKPTTSKPPALLLYLTSKLALTQVYFSSLQL